MEKKKTANKKIANSEKLTKKEVEALQTTAQDRQLEFCDSAFPDVLLLFGTPFLFLLLAEEFCEPKKVFLKCFLP